MYRVGFFVIISVAALAGCTPRQMTYADAVAYCQDKADAAAGPQGHAGISIGTSGTRANLGLSISDAYLRGDDPDVVYANCMDNLRSNGQITGVAQ